MAVGRRMLPVLAVLATVAGCSGVPAASTSPGAAPQPSSLITTEMVRLTESTILQGLDSGIEQAFQACRTKAQQGGDAEVSNCDAGKTASLEARKALVECFVRADQAPTPSESISAIMLCQQQMPH